jgi:uncharacterized protein YyaL (SSP411 family)
MSTSTSNRENRLAREKSPYLLQHARNPVDWYPWGEEAFEAARARDVPVFLSIGYSTCHWCHVMERESFEDDGVAALLGEGFVAVKVDREERPDIDAVYMTVCQMMTGGGGWPLTILMTPDRRPFFAATYIPRTSRRGGVGLTELLPRVTELWSTRRDELERAGDEIAAALTRTASPGGDRAASEETLEQAQRRLSRSFDPAHGGFGRAPKFPTPHRLGLLLRDWWRSGRRESLRMVEQTLEAMRRGGVFDQIGFGFHRYSTDSRWLVPHFEKMLYDQALMTLAALEAFRATGGDAHADIARETIEYVLRDLSTPEGGFASAEDADSEGEEGRFYLWTAAEVREVLGAADAERFTRVFGFGPDDAGNFRDEATGAPAGRNIPHLPVPLDQAERDLGLEPGVLSRWLPDVRARLLERRSTRPRPARDDKVLADWNGLMIAALARAAATLDDARYLDAARRAADFVLSRMRTPAGGLLHRFRDGEAAVPAFLDDHAFLAWGLLELYEASFEPRYLETAIALTRELNARFWDDEHGGYFQTSDRAERVLTRHKDAYDGATPSGNSVAASNLVRLGLISGDPAYEERAARVLAAFGGSIDQAPEGFAFMLQALSLLLGPTYEVVVVGGAGERDTAELLRAVRLAYVPQAVVLLRPDGEAGEELLRIAPFAREMRSIDGRATAYVCRGNACELPTPDLRRMLDLLGATDR